MKTTTKKKTKAITMKQLAVKTQAVAVVKRDETLALIDRAARDAKVDVPKMRELLDLKLKYEGILRNDAFQQALIACQVELPDIEATTKNEDGKGKYAKLVAIERAIKPIYLKHGFVPTYTSRTDEGGQKYVGCWLMHKSGHKEYYELPGQIDDAGIHGKKNKTWIQGLGTMVSYLRRYLLCMIFNITPYDEDKDGAATQPHPDEIEQEPQDKFTSPVEGVVIENDQPEWKPSHGVSIKLKPQMLKYTEGAGLKCEQAANYLSSVIAKRTHKQSRIDLINENLPLMTALAKNKKMDVITALHKLADGGE